ncbi:MAG: hypothetical protein KAH32_07145 [Chlamydiia bacterium]|nr:hypothetical protein [Chlamydiia bacterium]
MIKEEAEFITSLINSKIKETLHGDKFTMTLPCEDIDEIDDFFNSTCIGIDGGHYLDDYEEYVTAEEVTQLIIDGVLLPVEDFSYNIWVTLEEWPTAELEVVLTKKGFLKVFTLTQEAEKSKFIEELNINT